MTRARFAASIVVAMLLVSSRAAADASSESPKLDTAHGRLDGDLSVVGSVGATFGPRSPRATADLRLRYLWSSGIFVTYEDGPAIGASTDPRRVIAFGVEVRPLFLARWSRGLEGGSPRVDLFVDSLALELGAAFVQPPSGNFASKPGLTAGLGLELPIFPRATGPIIGLHGGARFGDSALAGQPILSPSDRTLFLAITVGWQQVFGAHVVDVGDRP